MTSLPPQTHTFLFGVSTVFIAGFVLLLTHIIYNVFFHPLAHVPGPFWARATGFPSWYQAKAGRRHEWLLDQFRKYGYRFRSEPNTVLFCDPDADKDIYSMKSNVKRSQFYIAWKRSKHDVTILNVTDPAAHARKRKILNLSFTDKTVSAAAKFTVRHVDRWLQLIADEIGDDSGEWSAPVDFSRKVDALVFDIMGDLCFGKSSDIKEPGENALKAVPHLIKEYMQFYYPISRSPFIDLVNRLKLRGLNELLTLMAPPAIKMYDQFVYDSVTTRIALQKEESRKPESERRQDIFYFLAEARDPDNPTRPAYSEAELRAESNILIIAGSDTTAISLSGTFFYLTGDPERCDRLAQEILSTFGSVDEIVHGPKLSGCTYLKACIDEGMRLTPAGPSETPREVLAGGIVIKGDYYPAGTIVGTAAWANAHNRDVYGDPEVFRPERWIADDKNGGAREEVARLRHNFYPFSSGPGNCVGQKVAMAEMMIILARTLYSFEVRRAPGSTLGCGKGVDDRDRYKLVDAFVAVREGPEVQFRKRVVKRG